MTVLVCRMVQVTEIVPLDLPAASSLPDDDPVESILRELEPMMAYQRKQMVRVWGDRSVSKLNLHVLMVLEQFGPMPMSRLASLVDVGVSNLTGIVDRMEQHGLVQRARDDRDRRVVFVRATSRGAECYEEMEGLRREQLRQLVSALDVADRPVVLRALQAFGRAVTRVEAEDETDRV